MIIDMRYLIFLPLALLLGLFIGGWGPNAELLTLRRDLADANKKLASRENDSRIGAITRMVHIPDRAAAKPRPKPQPPAPEPAPEPLAPEDLHARIEEAKELWATRVQIAREQWINRLKLNPEGEELFDAAINAMNADLQSSIQNLADLLAADAELTPELGTRFFNEMTDSLVRAYDDFDAFVPNDSRGEASKIELTDFIDPAVAEPLIAVQNKLDGNAPVPGERRRGFMGRGRR